MRRCAALGLVIIAALYANGCGSKNSTGATTASPQTKTFTPAPGDAGSQGSSGGNATVNVVDAGFTRTDKQTSDISYGIVLENVSTTDDAFDIQVTANFVGPSGTIMLTEGDTIGVIPAGTRYYYAGQTFPSKSDKTTKLETTVTVGSSAPAAYVFPEISDVRMSWDQYLGLQVRGVVKNPYQEAISSYATIFVVCFNESGRVVGGGYTFLDNDLPPGGRAAFEAGNGLMSLKKGDVRSVKVTMGNGDLLQ